MVVFHITKLRQRYLIGQVNDGSYNGEVVKSHSQTLVFNLFPLWDSNLLTLLQGQLQLFVYNNNFLKKDNKYSFVCKTQRWALTLANRLNARHRSNVRAPSQIQSVGIYVARRGRK
jgi:hypothetical protein